MKTISNSFGAVGVGPSFYVKNGDSIDYEVSGTFSATLILERSDTNGNTWERVKQVSAAESGRIDVNFKGARAGLYRFQCRTYASGTAITHISSVDTFADDGDLETIAKRTSVGVGQKNGSTVTVAEYGNSVIHKTVLTLTSMPISVVSVTTGNGVGGTKVYDMPEGYIKVLGCTAALSLAVETEDDFTDGTPEGDIGIGTVAPANADALGTDATDDNIGTATAFTMTDYADASVNIPPEAAINLDGTSTPIDVYVNALVDAADIDDDTTTNLLVSGTITLTWINMGDY